MRSLPGHVQTLLYKHYTTVLHVVTPIDDWNHFYTWGMGGFKEQYTLKPMHG